MLMYNKIWDYAELTDGFNIIHVYTLQVVKFLKKPEWTKEQIIDLLEMANIKK